MVFNYYKKVVNLPFLTYIIWTNGGRSSVGRAPDCGSGCRGFEPRRSPHWICGGVAQLGEHLICIQKVAGSIPVTSTINTCNYMKLLILYGLNFTLEVILEVIFPKTLSRKFILILSFY